MAPGSCAAPFACPVEERMYGYASQPDALSSCRADITLACRETVEHGDHPGRGAGGTHPPLADSRALRRAVRLLIGEKQTYDTTTILDAWRREWACSARSLCYHAVLFRVSRPGRVARCPGGRVLAQ